MTILHILGRLLLKSVCHVGHRGTSCTSARYLDRHLYIPAGFNAQKRDERPEQCKVCRLQYSAAVRDKMLEECVAFQTDKLCASHSISLTPHFCNSKLSSHIWQDWCLVSTCIFYYPRSSSAEIQCLEVAMSTFSSWTGTALLQQSRVKICPSYKLSANARPLTTSKIRGHCVGTNLIMMSLPAHQKSLHFVTIDRASDSDLKSCLWLF